MLFYSQDQLFEHRPRHSNRSVFAIVFLILVAISHPTRANGVCVSKKSHWGYILEGYAYDSTSAENYPTCLSRCLTDNTRCKSVSYDLAAKTCELSIYSRWTKEWAFKPKTNSIYMEMVGVVEVFTNVTEPPSIQTTQKPGQATTSPGDSARSGTFSSATFCAGKADGDYSHPTDCNQYVSCSAAITISRPCGVGMNFDPVKKICDFASNVVCP